MQGQDLNWLRADILGEGVHRVVEKGGGGVKVAVAGCWHIARFEVLSCTFDVTSCLPPAWPQKEGGPKRDFPLRKILSMF